MADIDWKRNVIKTFAIVISGLFFTVITYGSNIYLLVANSIVLFIIGFMSTNFVDVYFYYLEKKKRVKRYENNKGEKMIFQTIKPNIEVYFENGHHVGTIVYDAHWSQWRMEFTKGTRLSYHYLKDIFKFMRRLS